MLGLHLSDHIYLEVAPGMKIEISFFHGNERHHSYAVAPRAPTPGPKKSIHHFMVEARTVADVGCARDRAWPWANQWPWTSASTPTTR